MKTIAISLQKGGGGKTTLAVSLPVELARESGSVVLVDADPQGNTSSWIGPDLLDFELADVLTAKKEDQPDTLQKAVLKTGIPGLFLLPTAGLGGNLKTYIYSETEMKQLANFKNLIRETARQGYRFCVIDLSPAFGYMERAAFIPADEIITPIMPDPFGMEGLEIFTDNLAHLKDEIEAVGMGRMGAYNRLVINAVDHRLKLHDEIIEDVKKAAKQKAYFIPVDQAFRRAQIASHPIQAGDAKGDTLAEISRLASELAMEA
jgi:chromosome partitioning protein